MQLPPRVVPGPLQLGPMLFMLSDFVSDVNEVVYVVWFTCSSSIIIEGPMQLFRRSFSDDASNRIALGMGLLQGVFGYVLWSYVSMRS